MSRTIRPIRTTARTTVRAAACAAVVLGLGIGLTACSDTAEKVDRSVDEAVGDAVDEVVDEKYEVTYEVTGSGVDEIQFHVGGGKAMDPKIEKVASPTLPWRKTVTLRGITPPGVTPIVLDADGAGVTCSITYKGKVIEEGKGKDMLAAGGCVAVSPVVG
ncbi:MmpS family transport accessory protein [Streptomyces sp. NPDC002225]|uniref:MmpS family transport accessory protein n=1 Tax=Streptomyces sp. NPDC002225 TaxID=3154413 RepID=UPI00331BB9B0